MVANSLGGFSMRLALLVLIGGFLAAAPSLAEAQMDMRDPTSTKGLPTESGQSAFAAIHEIVGILEANPKTDWSKVNIDALRQHLVDMDNVTLHAKVMYQPLTNGEHIHVSGEGDVRDSIQRMVMMHASMAGDTPDWHMDATPAPDGAHINVTAKTPVGLQKLRALGFFGIMAEGMHHARHHMMLATGSM
jgi:hypothetical protein